MVEKESEPLGNERLVSSYKELKEAYEQNKDLHAKMSFEDFCEWTITMQAQMDKVAFMMGKRYVNKQWLKKKLQG